MLATFRFCSFMCIGLLGPSCLDIYILFNYMTFHFVGMLPLKDLADTIATKFENWLFVGAEVYGKKDDNLQPCKILKVIEVDGNKSQYEVAWLDRNKRTSENSILNEENVIRKKLPFSRRFFKSFIRDSTYRNLPWVLHEKLAQKHNISAVPPLELRDRVFFQNGVLVCKKRRKSEEEENEVNIYFQVIS